MCDVVKFWKTAAIGWFVPLLIVAFAVGACSSTGATQSASTAVEVSPAETVQSDEITLLALNVSQGDVEATLDIEASRELVWRQYRDSQGDLIVELPNVSVGGDVSDFADPDGLLSRVDLTTSREGDRPLTQLRVVTHSAAEHELRVEGTKLIVSLKKDSPQEDLVVAYAPIEEDPIVEEPVMLGTADDPLEGDPVMGIPATRLDKVEIAADGGIAIRGDGEFVYEQFFLSNPERFVIDLKGVTNLSQNGTVEAYGPVSRVRVAQYRPNPDPVTRVVFDLEETKVPVVEKTSDGLNIRFSDEGHVAPAETYAEVQETPIAESVVVDESMAVEESEPVVAFNEEEISAPVAEAVAEAPTPYPTEEAMASEMQETSDVSLFEALDIQDEVEEAEEAGTANYESLEVGRSEKIYTGEPIDFEMRDADITEVIRTFAKLSGLNIIIQPGVKGSVTVNFEQVPWDQALEQILKVNNLWYELEGNIMRIAPRGLLVREAQAEAERKRNEALSVPLRTIVKRVSYAKASSVANLLKSASRVRGGFGGGILSQRGTVTVDGRTNTLIIQELPDYIETVLAVIEEIDEPEPQVVIEARIVETSKRFGRTLGIQWGFNGVADAAHGNTTDLTFPNNATTDGGVNLLTGGATGFVNLSLGNILNTFTLDARLQAAEDEGLVNVLSSPKVTVLNNESAEIQSGLQIPIQTVSNNTVSVQFVNATLRLRVTPHVTAEGTVLMDLSIQKREPQLAFAVVGATNAPIATKEAKTRVIVRDGGVTVIGGIYSVSSDSGEDRVPGLSNIPLLGRLFKNKRQEEKNEELLIFVTPRVVKM